jgi:hypothetical protein
MALPRHQGKRREDLAVRRRGARAVTAWDIAGAFALIGCAAAMLSESENVVNLLGPTMVP